MNIKALYAQYMDILVSSALGGVVALSISFSYFNPMIDALQQHADATPPIIVVDMAKLALEAVPIGSDPKALKEHFSNTQKVLNKLKAAGFLVLSSDSVISSPEILQLTESDMPKNKYLTSKNNDG